MFRSSSKIRSSVLKMELTYEIAMAIATDEGNRHMREHGREKWDYEDFNAAVREFNRIWEPTK